MNKAIYHDTSNDTTAFGWLLRRSYSTNMSTKPQHRRFSNITCSQHQYRNQPADLRISSHSKPNRYKSTILLRLQTHNGHSTPHDHISLPNRLPPLETQLTRMLPLFPGYAEPLPADPAPQQPDHHADRGLSGETWPSWEGIECIPHFPHDFPTVDNTPNVAGWRVRARSPKYRPRLQASHERKLVCLDETAWVSLKQWKLHRRAVNGWKANYARWKATLPEPANNVRQGYTFKGAPKFENALIDVLDRRRFEAIKAQCADDDMDIDGGNKQKTKISKEQNAQELIDPSVGQQLSNDAMESLSSLSIQQQEPTKPKPIFSVAGLLKELTIDQTQPERRIATPRKLTGPTKRPLNYWQQRCPPFAPRKW